MILIYLTIMHAVNAVQIKSNKEPKYILKHDAKIKNEQSRATSIISKNHCKKKSEVNLKSG